MRLAVFASGGGTNFQSILDSVNEGSLSASIKLLVSNDPNAGALKRAQQHDIPSWVVNPDHFDSRTAYTQAMLDTLSEHKVNFIALAGYLKKIPAAVVDAYQHRILNIHPALLPAFGGKGMYGKRVHQAVLDHGVRWSGATVHLVDKQYDTGPIVLQHPVPVKPDDTPERLAKRVLQVEHRLYPEALRLFAERRVSLEGRRVHIAGTYPLHNLEFPQK